MALPSPLPDSPTKWDGWKNYNSPNPYERLCLEFEANPSDFQIEENCRQLLVWWQKKLPLKNQPSNPITRRCCGNGHRRGAQATWPRRAWTILLTDRFAPGSAWMSGSARSLRESGRQPSLYKFSCLRAFTMGTVSKREDETNLYNLGSGAGLEMD